MKRRILSVLATCCLLATMTPVAFAAGGNLTQVGGVYQIDDAADLVAFANLVNGGQTGANAVLTNTIDLGEADFTPIGSDYNNPYSGTFDGAGYTIKNATITGSDDENGFIRAGVFGCVDGTVKDITFEEITVTNSSSASASSEAQQAASGVAVSTLRQGGNIEDVTVLATCSVSGVYRTGGIVGSVRQNSTVSGCTNRASVTGSANYTGGIVGSMHDISLVSGGATTMSCANYGEVNGTSEVGGIVGYIDRGEISECNNYADVTGSGNYGVGGIVGCNVLNPIANMEIFIPTTTSTITACYNEGTINGPRAGGILGSFVVAPNRSQSSSRNTTCAVSACTNAGDINTENSSDACGAIYGAPITYMNGAGDQYVDHLIVLIQNCYIGGSVRNTEVSSENFQNYVSGSNYVTPSNNVFYEEVIS